ncbi:acyltransferase family protein [Roseomonas rosulenta]|uniref:acyltransferase family protein n=1 Tax=Roseomonas rosulenta TaxID=2748667 RepID=UPI0018DF5D22|nr:acyltransferase family protein [Roseomonas rosulenta]
MTPPSSPRRHDVDNLRSLAVLLLVPFHTARLFDATPWHMKDAAAPHAGASVLLRAIELWQMPLLFLLAGMAAAYALESRGPAAFLRERAARLLLPLAFGILVLVPPQVWVERVTPAAPLRQSAPVFAGDFMAFLPEAFVCCYPAANFSWHHLWFLPYLLLYAVLLALVSRGGDVRRLAAWIAASPWRLLLPAGLLVALELLLRPAFPGSHDLVADWANHAHYGLLVILGWWFARNAALEAAVTRRWGLLTGLALLAAALWFAGLPAARGGMGLLDLSLPARLALRTAAEWLVLLALLAAARRWLAHRVPILVSFAPLSFAFYMLHQTVIVLLGWTLFDWTGAPLSKGLVIAAATFVISLGGAALIGRTAWLRPLFGMGAVGRRVGGTARCEAQAQPPTSQFQPPSAATLFTAASGRSQAHQP